MAFGGDGSGEGVGRGIVGCAVLRRDGVGVSAGVGTKVSCAVGYFVGVSLGLLDGGMFVGNAVLFRSNPSWIDSFGTRRTLSDFPAVDTAMIASVEAVIDERTSSDSKMENEHIIVAVVEVLVVVVVM